MASRRQRATKGTLTKKANTPTPDELSRISGIQGIIDLFCETTNLSAGIAGAATLQGPTHLRRFCNLLRSSPGGLMRCAECDMSVLRQAAQSGSTTIHECFAGLLEIATPIHVDGQIVAQFFAGQVLPRLARATDKERIGRLAKSVEIPTERLIEAYYEVPVIPSIKRSTRLAEQAAKVIGDMIALALRQPNPKEAASELLASVSIVDWLRSTKEQTVLVLGKDTPPEVDLLREIQQLVDGNGYKAVLVKDYDDIDSMSNEQKVIAFAQASRFAVIENTFPAGQIDECRLCAMNRVVTIMLRQKGKGSSFLVTDYGLDFPFMKEFVYSEGRRDTSLAKAIERGVTWAETTLKRRTEFYRGKYPWRQSDGCEDSGEQEDVTDG